MEHIKGSQIRSYAKRLERANLKCHGSSLTAGSIAAAANPFIDEIEEMYEDSLIMREGWREAMKVKAKHKELKS